MNISDRKQLKIQTGNEQNMKKFPRFYYTADFLSLKMQETTH
jgi:hypothetical protein